jgi:hypothetical protein
MKLEGTGTLLRIYVGESDRWQAKPLYEAIVLAARHHGLAGATVLRGSMGFGASSIIHSASGARVTSDPMVIEIVDAEAKIHEFLPVLDEMVTEGMITLEKVQILRYRGRQTR